MKSKISPLITVILPTYNEAQGIQLFLDKVLQYLKVWAIEKRLKLAELAEIIVVDDNSPDGTAAKVREFSKTHPQVRLIVRTENPGLGLSILAGVKASLGKIIVGMDADNNHDPAQIQALVTQLATADLVVASRFIGAGGMENQFRFYGTWLFNLLLRCLGFPIWDNFSGFYAINKLNLLDLGLERIYYGYGDYHLRLVFYAKIYNLKILEIPTKYLPRLSGQSKSNLIKLAVKYFIEALRLQYLS